MPADFRYTKETRLRFPWRDRKDYGSPARFARHFEVRQRIAFRTIIGIDLYISAEWQPVEKGGKEQFFVKHTACPVNELYWIRL